MSPTLKKFEKTSDILTVITYCAYMKNMEAIELNFCRLCSQQIKSRDLADFWKTVCLHSVIHEEWVSFHDTEELITRCIKILEEKDFIISLDHDSEIFVKPKGIHNPNDDCYLICLSPSSHFRGDPECVQ